MHPPPDFENCVYAYIGTSCNILWLLLLLGLTINYRATYVHWVGNRCALPIALCMELKMWVVHPSNSEILSPSTERYLWLVISERRRTTLYMYMYLYLVEVLHRHILNSHVLPRTMLYTSQTSWKEGLLSLAKKNINFLSPSLTFHDDSIAFLSHKIQIQDCVMLHPCIKPCAYYMHNSGKNMD